MTPRRLLLIVGNELLGVGEAALFLRCHPHPLVLAATALVGLALTWRLAWQAIEPELIARQRAALLAEARA